MSAPIRPDSIGLVVADLMRRVRGLEARRPDGGACCYGEGWELDASQTIGPGFEIISWNLDIDEHGFFDGGSPTLVTIPTGLGGAYLLSIAFIQGGE